MLTPGIKQDTNTNLKDHRVSLLSQTIENVQQVLSSVETCSEWPTCLNIHKLELLHSESVQLVQSVYQDVIEPLEQAILQKKHIITTLCEQLGLSSDTYMSSDIQNEDKQPLSIYYRQVAETWHTCLESEAHLQMMYTQRAAEYTCMYQECYALETLLNEPHDFDETPCLLTRDYFDSMRDKINMLKESKQHRQQFCIESLLVIYSLVQEMGQTSLESMRDWECMLMIQDLLALPSCDARQVEEWMHKQTHSQSTLDTEFPVYTHIVTPQLHVWSREFMQQCQDMAKALEQEKSRRVALLQEWHDEIHMLWDQLETPLSERQEGLDFKDLKNMDACREYADKLRQEWLQHMKDQVDQRMEQLQLLWQQCHVSDKEQAQFYEALTNLYSPLTVVLLDQHIHILSERFKKWQHIYQLITKRRDYIQRIVDFEKSASDPKRLFGKSTRLLEEEKFRRTCFPTLLSMEQELKQKCEQAEQESGAVFMYQGQRYLNALETEIADRFINTTVFVLDGIASNATTKTVRRRSSSVSLSHRKELAVQGAKISSSSSPRPQLKRSTSSMIMKPSHSK